MPVSCRCNVPKGTGGIRALPSDVPSVSTRARAGTPIPRTPAGRAHACSHGGRLYAPSLRHASRRPARPAADRRRSPPGAFPATIQLPNGWRPEGITAGHGSTVYVGLLANGAIAKVNVRTGKVDAGFVDPVGKPTVGIDFDFRSNRIWAAGGDSHEVRVYSARTGALLQTYAFTSGFINDVAVTRDAVYATDSNMQQLLVIPLGSADSPEPSVAFARPITGDFVYLPGFNANGIENFGSLLIVPQSNTGALYAINGRTGVSRELLPAGSVPNADGLERKGLTLFVVRIRTTWSTSTGSRSAA